MENSKYIAIIRQFFPAVEIIFLDTEYNQPNEANMGLLCLCSEAWPVGATSPDKRSFWVQNDPTDKASCISYFEKKKGAMLVAHSLVAEYECLIALGFRPFHDFKGACTYLEAVQLQNSWDEYTYGKYFDALGQVRFSTPPKRQISKHMSDEERQEAQDENLISQIEAGADSTAEWNPNLLNCLLNFTDLGSAAILGHYGTKSDTRRLILSKYEFTAEERREIVEYCRLDVDCLPALLAGELVRLRQALGKKPEQIAQFVMNRGRRSAHVAKQQRRGIPINMDRYRNICINSGDVIQMLKLEWNEKEFPLYRDDTKSSTPRMAYRKLVWDQQLFDAWVRSQPEASIWPKSKRGFSSDSKALDKLSAGEESAIGRYVRHRKEVKVLEFYKPENLSKEFLHNERLANLDRTIKKNYVGFFVGSDGRMRPHLNPYGTQTGRNGHKAVGFIPAQGKIMRVLIDPPPGYVIIECDYSAQEDLIPASQRLSGDENILAAYNAGDPYLAFAALTGKCDLSEVAWWVKHREDQSSLTPEEKARHKLLSKYRKDAKPQKLGVGFGMKPNALARHMKASVEEARAVYNAYWNRVSKYSRFRERLQMQYEELHEPIILQNGWALGPDNRNALSMLNLPVQGTGVVMAEAFQDLLEVDEEFINSGANLLATVHDAGIALAPEENAEKALTALVRCMKEASRLVLDLDCIRVGSEMLRHGELWRHDVPLEKFERWLPYFRSAPDVDLFLRK